MKHTLTIAFICWKSAWQALLLRSALTAFVFAPLAALNAADAATGLVVRDLRCEYQERALNIEVQQPRLSWKLSSSQPNQKMTAYQILVASSADRLQPGKSDLWDSGKVQGEEFNGILFGGKPLLSGKPYYWKVRCWDAQGKEGSWSEVATWRMGLLADSDWPKEWLGAPRLGKSPQDGTLSSEFFPVWQFRKDFKLKAQPKSATLYVAAVGVVDIWFNGKPASDALLDPALTEFRKRVPYVARDLTSLVKSGENCLGLRLGNGFANLVAETPFLRLSPRFQAVLRVEYPDGSVENVTSSPDWKTTPSEVTFNCFFGGEAIDARLRNPQWSQPGGAKGNWEAPALVEAPLGKRHAQMIPPMRVTEVVKPISIKKLKPGVWSVDLGVNMTGWLRFRGHGKAGQEVKIFWNELLFPDGSMQKHQNNRNAADRLPKENRDNLSDHGRYQEIRLIFSGAAQEEFEPRFFFGTGRYVQIEGLDYEPALSDIVGCTVHTDMDLVGNFTCSNERINQLHAASVRTFRNCWKGNPLNESSRERIGWTREGVTTLEACTYNFNCLLGYEKWIGDHLDMQAEDGTLSMKAPERFKVSAKSNPDGACTIIFNASWILYERYGDPEILRRSYNGAKKYVDVMLANFPDGLVPSLHRDHTAVGFFQARDAQQVALTMASPKEAEAFYLTPSDLHGGFGFYNSVALFVKTAAVLGETADAAKYGAVAEQIRKKLNARMNPANGAYAEDSQTLQALALAWKICEPTDRQKVFDYLCHNIVETRKGHLSTGVPATRDLFKVLTELGRGDLAMEMMKQNDYPSFGQMLENGSGTTWERWDGKSNICGAGLNAIDEWMYHSLAGIQADPEQPGFKHIYFRPGVIKDLNSARATYNSIRGAITSDWKREGNKLTLRIKVPVGSTGTVEIPVKSAGDVVAPVGAQLAKGADGQPAWTVGSGEYEFRATLPAKKVPASVMAKSAKKETKKPMDGHYIGERFGGGIVYWVTKDRQHGLIASLQDLDGGAGVPWSNIIDEKVGRAAAKAGDNPGIPGADGRGSTQVIVAQKGHTGSAAQLCVDYAAGGFKDWFLPSRIELQLLAAQTALINRDLENDNDPKTHGLNTEYAAPTWGGYWSSSEFNADCGFGYDFNYSGDTAHLSTVEQPVELNFSRGNASFRSKDVPYRVRAVRRF